MEEYETRKCLWTAAARYDAELDRGDGIYVTIFGPPKIYLPGPIITGGTVIGFGKSMDPSKHCCAVGLAGGGAAIVYKCRAVLNPHLNRLSTSAQVS